jgi:hypothetical protein
MFLRCSVTQIPSGPRNLGRAHFGVSARELLHRTEVAHAPPIAVQEIALAVSAETKQPKNVAKPRKSYCRNVSGRPPSLFDVSKRSTAATDPCAAERSGRGRELQ